MAVLLQRVTARREVPLSGSQCVGRDEACGPRCRVEAGECADQDRCAESAPDCDGGDGDAREADGGEGDSGAEGAAEPISLRRSRT